MSAKLPPALEALLPGANAAPSSAGALPPALAALLPPAAAPKAAPSAGAPAQSSGLEHFLFGNAANKTPTWRSLWGVPDAVASIGSSALAQVGAGLGGLGELALTRNVNDAARTVRNIEGLAYRPRTTGGQGLTHLASLPFTELGKAANAVGQKVSGLTGSPLAGAAINTAMQAAPMALGGALPELRDAPEAPEVPEAVQSARSIGLKLTPNQAQVPGGILGRAVESLAGHAKLERALSRANADVVTTAAAREAGVSGPLTAATLKAAKAAPNAVYDEVAKVGNIPTDDTFRQQIAAIHNPGGGTFAFDTPQQITALKEGYGAIKNFGSGEAIDTVRRLRKEASAKLRVRDNPVMQAEGYAQRAVYNALEDQIDRHLQSSGAGSKDLIDRYRKARMQLAKIHNVQDAFRAGKGQAVSALNLGKQLDRGTPFTGDLRKIAEAAQNFPRSFQDISKIRDSGPFSNLDFKLEGGLGILKPMAALKALPLLGAQPMLRGLLGSDMYQDAAFGPHAPVAPSFLKLAARGLPATAAGNKVPLQLFGPYAQLLGAR